MIEELMYICISQASLKLHTWREETPSWWEFPPWKLKTYSLLSIATNFLWKTLPQRVQPSPKKNNKTTTNQPTTDRQKQTKTNISAKHQKATTLTHYCWFFFFLNAPSPLHTEYNPLCVCIYIQVCILLYIHQYSSVFTKNPTITSHFNCTFASE